MNDYEVRRWSWSASKKIEESSHHEWFRQKMLSTEVWIWICQTDDTPCGVVRAERSQGEVTIHYSISSEFRGRKFGQKMLALGVDNIFKNIDCTKIIAHTFMQNIASHKSLESVGFSRTHNNESNNCITYELDKEGSIQSDH